MNMFDGPICAKRGGAAQAAGITSVAPLTYLVGNLDICAVKRADDETPVHRELHIRGACKVVGGFPAAAMM